MKKRCRLLLFLILFLGAPILSRPLALLAQERIPPHQLKIEADSGTFGKWILEVRINDKTIGKFGKCEDIDITPYLKWGKNMISQRAVWKENTLPVRMIIGVKRGDRWMTAYSYMKQDSGQEVRKEIFTVHRSLPAVPVVDGQYVMKVEADSGTMGSWSLMPYINGRQVGTYYSRADADVSSFVMPGRNNVTVRGKWIKDTYDVKLTIGRKTGSSWKTVVNCVNRKSGTVSRDFQFDAKGLASAGPRKIKYNHVLRVIADSGTYGKWELEVLINGKTVQTVTASTSIGINEFLKPGKNSMTIMEKFTEDTPHPVELTVGAEKSGKWSALLKYVNRKKGTHKKDFDIVAE